MAATLRTAERVREIVAEHLGHPLERATDDANLRDDLGADSLDIVELAMAIEEEFGIEIPDNEADAWVTAGDVIRCIEGKR